MCTTGRTSCQRSRIGALLIGTATILAALAAPHAASASTYIWNVDADGEWTNPANWQHVTGSGPIGDGYPNRPTDVAAFTGTYTGDRAVVFGASQLTVGSIVMNTPFTFSIVAGAGGRLVLDNGAGPAELTVLGPSQTGSLIDAPMLLNGSLTVTVAEGGSLRLSSLTEIGTSRDVTKRGPGHLRFLRPNQITGQMTVAAGAMSVESTVSGTVFSQHTVVGDGVSSAAAILSASGSNQFPQGTRLTANAGGIAQLARVSSFSSIVIQDGIVQASSPDARITTGGLEMRGGRLELFGSSEVRLAGDAIVSPSATSAARVTTFGSSAPLGSLVLVGGARTLTVNDGAPETDLEIGVPVRGTGAGLVKDGAGTLRFTGPDGNSYTASTVVRRGRLELAREPGANVVPGEIVIGGAGATAVVDVAGGRTERENIIDDATVVVRAGGLFSASANEVLGRLIVENGGRAIVGERSAAEVTVFGLQLAGGRVTVAAGALLPTGEISAVSTATLASAIDGAGELQLGFDVTLVVNDGPQAIDLHVGARVSNLPGLGRLTKRGAGTAEFAAIDTHASGTTLAEGMLAVTGRHDRGLTTVTGGALAGTGMVGALTVTSGRLAPGIDGPGRLASGAVTFAPAAAFVVQLNGGTRGIEYDQLAVSGSVDLGAAALSLSIGAQLPPASRYTIIENDGTDAVSGTFAGLPEGAIVEADARTFSISYRGGDGNDVMLTDISPVSYYLAEGATGDFFDDDVLIANPNATAAPVTLTFLLEGGRAIVEHRTVPAQARLTVHVDQIPGLEATSASVQVTSDDRLPLVVERSMFWSADYYGGHTATAVAQPERRWIFAEGFQGFFDTFVLIANANAEPTTATLTFLREGAPPVVATVAVGAFARKTVYAGDYPELAGRAFGIVVEAAHPVIAERAMYFASQPGRIWAGGHANTGTVAPATEWFHAEGATGGFFSTFILLSNPNDAPAHVTLRFLLSSGAVVTREKTIGAQARLTINPAAEGDARLENAAVSTVVLADVPIVSERSMYWPGEAAPFGEGHNSAGVTSLATHWGLAEGRVGGPHGFATYILLANPGDTAAQVTLTYLRESGAPVVRTYTVPPTSRFNVDTSGIPELADAAFGARIDVTNNVPIAVERSLYWNAAGVFWAGGTNALAMVVP